MIGRRTRHMKAKVVEENRNPIFKRKEMPVEIAHDENGTPDRIAIKKLLASQLDEKPENLYVVKVEGKTGTDHSLCHIQIYESKGLAVQTLPKHIITRNLPPEERKAKKAEAKPQEPQKAKAAEKPRETKPQEAKKEKATEKAPSQETPKPKK